MGRALQQEGPHIPSDDQVDTQSASCSGGCSFSDLEKLILDGQGGADCCIPMFTFLELRVWAQAQWAVPIPIGDIFVLAWGVSAKNVLPYCAGSKVTCVAHPA